ncbi:hypothetical protein Glove_759g20 [Diversispora epigaea]|uniref:Rhomboid-type serine protease n=1 Tax=Diversispora epigaea TaxID=1348612 RepID=A0A397G062_9GLOM|nr:hypothetical protein Glove_759g20 [Diversispora epigaea]
MSNQSSWNQFFQSYDSPDDNSQPIPPYEERPSYFSYNDEYPPTNIPLDVHSTPIILSPTDLESQSRHSTAPSAPPASEIDLEEHSRDLTTVETHYENYEKEEENDEDMARRLFREERDQYINNSNQKSSLYMGQGYQDPQIPRGEAESYYQNVNYPESFTSRRDTLPSLPPVPPTTRDPKYPKALLDPKVQKQLQKKTPWIPFFTWIVTAIQLFMLIFEFIKSKEFTGEVIQTNPLNPMIGPGAFTFVQLGARFVPCMKPVYNDSVLFDCPTIGNPANTCNMSEYCGLGGFKSGQPDQWYRFITPVFLHAGIVHFAFNMIFQLQTGLHVEKDIGWWRFSIIYMASGIFGFIFGGNFDTPLSPSMGASGSLFGIVGVILLELLQNWKIIRNPRWELIKLSLVIILSFSLGLLPGLDNFSHIGGFIMGVITGCVLNPTINFSKFHKRANWALKIIALPIAILLFFVLIRNFYATIPSDRCKWCKYLSCIPISNWCDQVDYTS